MSIVDGLDSWMWTLTWTDDEMDVRIKYLRRCLSVLSRAMVPEGEKGRLEMGCQK